MARLILVTILFLLSLLVFFRAPTNFLWYVSILVTEFSALFIMLTLVFIFWKFGGATYNVAATLIGIAAIALFLLPYIQAYRISQKLDHEFSAAFSTNSTDNNEAPFQLLKIATGINAKKLPYETLVYDEAHGLTLDLYKGSATGKRPCIIVIHGGSWAGGDSKQLPELNSELAKGGYIVASINYRLAPASTYPAPLQDLQKCIRYLRTNAAGFYIDTNNIVLLGRSAGGQIALSAAYTLKDPGIKGVICFYGPADMVWGYQNPTNPLVLDSRKIMKDYLGGTLNEVPAQYRHSSATETVTKQTPPTLLLYGENDPLVSPRHGTRLSAKLRAQNIALFELYLPWATHGFDYTLYGPGGQLSTWTVKRFLEVVVSRK